MEKIVKAIIVCAFITIAFVAGYLFGTQDCNCVFIEFEEESMEEQECFIEGKKAGVSERIYTLYDDTDNTIIWCEDLIMNTLNKNI